MGLRQIIASAPVIAQATSFSEAAKNFTQISDPFDASVQAIRLIIDVCAPPQLQYPFKCTILALQFGLCVSSGGLTSVTSVALGIGTAKQVLEEILKP